MNKTYKKKDRTHEERYVTAVITNALKVILYSSIADLSWVNSTISNQKRKLAILKFLSSLSINIYVRI